MLRTLALTCLFAAPCLAQPLISPITVDAMTPGNTGNAIPFASGTARRYQQLHGDVGPRTIAGISFRQNEGNTVNFTGTRALDLELWMANSTVDCYVPSTTFAQNYSTAPTLVIARKLVTFGPQGQNVATGAASFSGMQLLLDAPFARPTATRSLVWEAVVFANTGSGVFNNLDAEQSSTTLASGGLTGPGCIATGRSSAMLHGAECSDVAGQLLLGFTAFNAPANAPLVLALGTANPNLPVAGLCSNLCTNLLVTLALPAANAQGLLLADAGVGIALPNTFANAVLHTQAHALDGGRTDPIKVCNSSGLSTTIPVPNPAKRALVTRVYNTVGGTTATNGLFQVQGGVGTGLVTRFE